MLVNALLDKLLFGDGEFCFLQVAGVDAVEGEQLCADEEKNRRDGDIQQAAEPDAFAGLTVGLRADISLDVALVDAEVLEVDYDTINEHDPEGWFSEDGFKAAETELVMFCRNLKNLPGPLRHVEEDEDRADNGSDYKHNCLQGIGPYLRYDSADKGVDSNRYAGKDNDPAEVFLEQDAQGQGHQIHDDTHACQLCEDIEEAGVDACPWAEAALQVCVGGDFTCAAVIGHEEFDSEPYGNGQRQAEDEGIPVGGVCLTGQRQEANAAQICSKDR